jgi:hypothetical protein
MASNILLNILIQNRQFCIPLARTKHPTKPPMKVASQTPTHRPNPFCVSIAQLSMRPLYAAQNIAAMPTAISSIKITLISLVVLEDKYSKERIEKNK